MLRVPGPDRGLPHRIGRPYPSGPDPPLALGTAAGPARTGIPGVAAILPFTCLTGTIVASLSYSFRKDHDGMPWVDIAFDGQEDTWIETRLQAFVHQAKEYDKIKGYDKPRLWN